MSKISELSSRYGLGDNCNSSHVKLTKLACLLLLVFHDKDTNRLIPSTSLQSYIFLIKTGNLQIVYHTECIMAGNKETDRDHFSGFNSFTEHFQNAENQ